MIRVLHLRDTDRICGPGKTILESVARIDHTAFKARIGLFVPQDRPDNPYLEAARARGLPIDTIVFRNPYDLGAVRQILELIDRHSIDVLHSHEYISDILVRIAAWFRPVATVSSAHGWIRNSRKSTLLIGLQKRVLRGFDRVIAVSPRIRDELARSGVAESRISLIYNAIVADDYRPEDWPAGAFRREWGIGEQEKVIASIGRLSPEKGSAEFLHAAARMGEAGAGCRFVLAGDGPSRTALEARARELGIADSVLFTGHLGNVRPLYRDADVLALTSWTEGFPNVVLEALCMGVPVLATDVGGTGDIVSDGETGMLVEAGDVDAMAAGLERLLTDRGWAAQTVANGRRRIHERFEFARRMEKVQQLYLNLHAAAASTADTT